MIILSTISIIIGGLNWLSIGLLQYDFIAGFFGTQASIFSRLLYIGIGACTIYIIFEIIRNKGKLLLFSRRKKDATKTNPQTQTNTNKNIESSSQNQDILN